ncbi:MAG: MarR family transcriptional regulator [Burkholderiaceae bacterium]|nr:MarR family transcriptional regulator [Burkholderiaceae bacterium]
MPKSTITAQRRNKNVTEDLYDQPGHLIRRAHQIAASLFVQHVGKGVTPIQYAILRMVHEKPGIDQGGLARSIALDTSTTAMAAARLEEKGLLKRLVVETNRRQLELHLTQAGEDLLRNLVSGVHTMRAQLLSSLEPREQQQFMGLLRKFVQLNNDQSRAPLQTKEPSAAINAPRLWVTSKKATALARSTAHRAPR